MSKLKIIGGIIFTVIVVCGLIKLFSWLLVSMVYVLTFLVIAIIIGLITWVITLNYKLNHKK